MKKSILGILMLPIWTIMLFACGDSKTDVKVLEGKWYVIEAEGQALETEGFPYLEFDVKGRRVHGNTGCNIFNATLVFDKDNASSIKFDKAMSTMMSCPNLDIETKVLKALNEVNAVKAGKDDKHCCLVDNNDKVVLILSRED